MFTIFHDIRVASSSKVVPFLLARGANPNQTSARGSTALHYAIMLTPAFHEVHISFQAVLDIIQLLLLNGSEVNVRDHNMETPLHYACHEGSVDTVRLLLRHGADHSLLNEVNEDPLALATSYYDSNSEPSLSLRRGQYKAVVDLITAVATAGSWKRYAREPEVKLLSLRYLCLAGRATAPSILLRLFGAPCPPASAARTRSRRLASSAACTLVPDEVFTHVLGFWNPLR